MKTRFEEITEEDWVIVRLMLAARDPDALRARYSVGVLNCMFDAITAPPFASSTT